MWMTLDWEKNRIWDRLEEEVEEDLSILDLMYSLPFSFYTKVEMYEYAQKRKELREELKELL